MRNIFPVFLLALSLMACATDKTLTATGGSKADGTVEMSYEIKSLEVPKIDYASATIAAKQRCSAWGYTDAHPVGGEKSECRLYYSGFCYRWLVAVTYQCTGGGQQ